MYLNNSLNNKEENACQKTAVQVQHSVWHPVDKTMYSYRVIACSLRLEYLH